MQYLFYVALILLTIQPFLSCNLYLPINDKSIQNTTTTYTLTQESFHNIPPMIPRRKRPLNPLRQRGPEKPHIEFKPKQTLPPLDLLADFQFHEKKQTKISDISLKLLLKDLYPYYNLFSITTCIVASVVFNFLWQQFHQDNNNVYKFLSSDHSLVSQFWLRLSIIIVYVNFTLIIGSYLESVHKMWFLMSYGLSYFVGIIVFLLKIGSINAFSTTTHIWTATYSVYLLILVQKKMSSKSLNQTWNKLKNLSIWKNLHQFFNPKQNQSESELIDFAFTQRPLSIKGGQTDDSFSYDSFFSYSDPFDFLSQQRNKGYFESNISKRSSYISSLPFQQIKQKPSNQNKLSAENKAAFSTSEIQSTIASSQMRKNQKLQQEQQMIKIYKTIIFSYLVYMNVTKVEWTAFLVAVCVILAWVQILTNQRLKVIKFACLTGVAGFLLCWL